MEATYNSNRKTARLAGFLFVLVCVPLVTWSQSYVASRIFAPNDPGATANNLLSNEFLFRTGIVSHLASNLTFAFVVLLLYRLFRPVDKHLSQLMVAPVLAQVAVFLVLELFNIASLMILKSEVQFTFDNVQRQELSYLLLRMHRLGIGASQFFWGLCFIPFGMLVYKSNSIPRILGILLFVSGIGYITDSCAFILLQRTDYMTVQPFIRITFIGFLMTMLWLLIKGVREQKATAH